MKFLLNLTLFCVTLFISTAAFSNTNPITSTLTPVDVESCTLNMDSEDNMYFNSIYYCTVVEKICFKAKAKIQFVQVLDSNDEVVMMLPIESEIMHLSMEELQKGDYKVNILIDGAKEVISTEVTKK